MAAKSSPSSELKIDYLESEVKKEKEMQRYLVNKLRREFEEKQFEMLEQIKSLSDENESLRQEKD